MPRYVRLAGEQRRRYEAGIVALEGGARYPLGEDTFTIDHGTDYFAFFDRLGEEERWVVLDDEDVVATASGVLRSLPSGAAWYVCDLKVDERARGRHLPVTLGMRAAPAGLLRCGRGYGISMNPPDVENPMARRLTHLSLPGIGVLGRLLLVVLDEAAVRGLRGRLERALGPIGFRSLKGVKDIVLGSTGAPMPLVHIQHGPLGDPASTEPTPGAVHMLSVDERSALARELVEAGAAVTATATVFHLGMDPRLLDWILSSDI